MNGEPEVNGTASGDSETDATLAKDSAGTDKAADTDTAASTEGAEKNGAEEGEEKGAEDKEQEVVLIQDTGFNITIVVPGLDEFELPVSTLSFLYLLF